MSQVILIYPPIVFKEDKPSVLDVTMPPLGILYLAAALERENVSVKVLDVGASNFTLTETLNFIRKEKPKIVGLSSMSVNLQGTYQLASKIKEEFGSKIILSLGGSHISADPQFINRHAGLFDFGITGESDITFPALVKDILNGLQVEGLYIGEVPLDLDALPHPARYLLDPDAYQGSSADIISSRGCPYDCIFCSRPAISKKMRFRSAKDVVNEMEDIYNSCNGKFIFEDDAFTMNRNGTLDLCQEMLRRNLKASWSAITRVDLVDEELLGKMKEAGCLELTFGIESGNERIRNEIIKKKATDEQIFKAITLCNRTGIDASGFLMLGFPTETKKELHDTVNFAKKLNLNIIGVHLSLPLPGSRLFNVALEEGIISYDLIDRFAKGEMGLGFQEVWPIYIPKGLTLEDLKMARRLAYYKFYFKPSYIWRRFLKDMKSFNNLKKDFLTAWSLLKYGRSQLSP